MELTTLSILGLFIISLISMMVYATRTQKFSNRFKPFINKGKNHEVIYSKGNVDNKIKKVLKSRARYNTNSIVNGLSIEEANNHLSANRDWYTDKVLTDYSLYLPSEDRDLLVYLKSGDFRLWDNQIFLSWREIVIKAFEKSLIS